MFFRKRKIKLTIVNVFVIILLYCVLRVSAYGQRRFRESRDFSHNAPQNTENVPPPAQQYDTWPKENPSEQTNNANTIPKQHNWSNQRRRKKLVKPTVETWPKDFDKNYPSKSESTVNPVDVSWVDPPKKIISSRHFENNVDQRPQEYNAVPQSNNNEHYGVNQPWPKQHRSMEPYTKNSNDRTGYPRNRKIPASHPLVTKNTPQITPKSWDPTYADYQSTELETTYELIPGEAAESHPHYAPHNAHHSKPWEESNPSPHPPHYDHYEHPRDEKYSHENELHHTPPYHSPTVKDFPLESPPKFFHNGPPRHMRGPRPRRRRRPHHLDPYWSSGTSLFPSVTKSFWPFKSRNKGRARRSRGRRRRRRRRRPFRFRKRRPRRRRKRKGRRHRRRKHHRSSYYTDHGHYSSVMDDPHLVHGHYSDSAGYGSSHGDYGYHHADDDYDQHHEYSDTDPSYHYGGGGSSGGYRPGLPPSSYEREYHEDYEDYYPRTRHSPYSEEHYDEPPYYSQEEKSNQKQSWGSWLTSWFKKSDNEEENKPKKGRTSKKQPSIRPPIYTYSPAIPYSVEGDPPFREDLESMKLKTKPSYSSSPFSTSSVASSPYSSSGASLPYYMSSGGGPTISSSSSGSSSGSPYSEFQNSAVHYSSVGSTTSPTVIYGRPHLGYGTSGYYKPMVSQVLRPKYYPSHYSGRTMETHHSGAPKGFRPSEPDPYASPAYGRYTTPTIASAPVAPVIHNAYPTVSSYGIPHGTPVALRPHQYLRAIRPVYQTAAGTAPASLATIRTFTEVHPVKTAAVVPYVTTRKVVPVRYHVGQGYGMQNTGSSNAAAQSRMQYGVEAKEEKTQKFSTLPESVTNFKSDPQHENLPDLTYGDNTGNDKPSKLRKRLGTAVDDRRGENFERIVRRRLRNGSRRKVWSSKFNIELNSNSSSGSSSNLNEDYDSPSSSTTTKKPYLRIDSYEDKDYMLTSESKKQV